MDPGGPPRPAPPYAGGPAAYRGEASSPSSPRRPPPPQQQQQHAIQPVWPRQPGPPGGIAAGALPLGFGPPVPWLLIPPLHPQFGLVPPLHPQFGLIPPLHPQFGSQQQQQHPYPSSGGYFSTVDAGTAAGNLEGNSGAIPGYPYHSLGPALGPTEWEAQQLQPPPIHQDQASKLEDIRWLLFHSPVDLLQLVMSPDPEYSVIVARRLQGGDKEMREHVLTGFKLCAHEIMGNWQGHAVFKALLDCFFRRYEQLHAIVAAAVRPHVVLRSRDGVTSLKWLISAVAWNTDLSTRLVNCFLRDRVMDDLGGDEVIAHCFIEMDYEVTRALITHAMETIDAKLHSPFGSACLGVCFRFAIRDELPLFRIAVGNRALVMAMGEYGTRLLQSLLDHGNIEFRRQLVLTLMHHVVMLSENQYGRFVLQHCFRNEEVELLSIVLEACVSLTLHDLHVLVIHASRRNFWVLPLHRLLQTGNTPFPAAARVLAQRIQGLPQATRDRPKLKPLMSAVTRVLADNLAELGN